MYKNKIYEKILPAKQDSVREEIDKLSFSCLGIQNSGVQVQTFGVAKR